MGKYDNIFNSEDVAAETLNAEEAIAACATIAAFANYPEEEIDAEILENLFWESEVFANYSEEEVSELADKLLTIAQEDGLGALFNAAYDALEDDNVADAFAAAVIVVADEEGVEDKAQGFLKTLRETLGVDEAEAEEIIDDVVASYAELDEDEGEFVIEIEPEIYESPQGNFSVPISVEPRKGGRVDEQPNSVGFSDDFGKLLRIDYWRMIDAEAENEEIKNLGREAYLQSYLIDHYIASAILDIIPNSEILVQQYLDDRFEGAYFAVVNLPQGGTLSVSEGDSPPKRLDAYRGLMNFIVGDFIYIVSNQRIFFEDEEPEDIDTETEKLLQELTEFVDEIEFR